MAQFGYGTMNRKKRFELLPSKKVRSNTDVHTYRASLGRDLDEGLATMSMTMSMSMAMVMPVMVSMPATPVMLVNPMAKVLLLAVVAMAVALFSATAVLILGAALIIFSIAICAVRATAILAAAVVESPRIASVAPEAVVIAAIAVAIAAISIIVAAEGIVVAAVSIVDVPVAVTVAAEPVLIAPVSVAVASIAVVVPGDVGVVRPKIVLIDVGDFVRCRGNGCDRRQRNINGRIGEAVREVFLIERLADLAARQRLDIGGWRKITVIVTVLRFCHLRGEKIDNAVQNGYSSRQQTEVWTTEKGNFRNQNRTMKRQNNDIERSIIVDSQQNARSLEWRKCSNAKMGFQHKYL